MLDIKKNIIKMAHIDLENEFLPAQNLQDKSISVTSDQQVSPTKKDKGNLPLMKSTISSSSENSHENPNWSLRKRIFCLFLYVTIFTNYDTGVIPAALIKIQKELDLNYEQQGLLGSLPYFGISSASILVSYLITRFPTKNVLQVSIFFNIAFCLLFTLSTNLWAMYFSRFFMGFTQAFWVIYAPVWTNYFSPHERQATWLGLLQGFSPLGFLLIVIFFKNFKRDHDRILDNCHYYKLMGCRFCLENIDLDPSCTRNPNIFHDFFHEKPRPRSY